MFRIKLGNALRTFISKIVMPHYWVCAHCGDIQYKEEEVTCWKCGLGDMIYQGKVSWK